MSHFLLFSVGEIRGALRLTQTTQVIRMVGLAEIPNARRGEAGSINFHGRLIPVFSPRRWFGLPDIPARAGDSLIITRLNDEDIALWVEETSGVMDIRVPEEPETGGADNGQFPGVLETPEGVRVILDPALLIRNAAGRMSEEQMSPATSDSQFPLSPGVSNASETRAILDARARILAQPERGIAEPEVIEVLRFRLAYREYAIGMEHIREVILTGKITPVPGTPEYITGICIVRGEIISLVDLRVFLSIPEKGLTDLNRVIVLSNHTLTFGILADRITGIGTIEMATMGTPPAEQGQQNPLIRGVVDNDLIVLDTAALFDNPRMIIEDG